MPDSFAACCHTIGAGLFGSNSSKLRDAVPAANATIRSLGTDRNEQRLARANEETAS